MKENVIKINTSELRPGMIVSKSFIINNLKLINKDVEISQSVADKLKKNYPQEYIEVYSHEAYDFLEEKKKSRISIKKTEEFFKKITSSCYILFSQIEAGEDPDIALIRELSEDLIHADLHQGLLLKNIITPKNIKEYKLNHAINTAILSVLLGKWLGYSQRKLKHLFYAGFLHDIGKEKLDQAVLYKKTSLTTKEYESIKRHSQLGYEMIKKIPYLDKSIAIAVLMHHEREDGSGYPLGLKGDQISPYGKIISIADTFDAMTSNRVYKSRTCPLEALAELRYSCFKVLDPKLCQLFIEKMINFYIGDQVLLNDGTKGTIIKVDINTIDRPLILTNHGFINLSSHKELSIIDIF